MRLRLLLALVLLGTVPAPAAAQLDFCGPSNRECTTLKVPLDRSGTLSDQVTLRVERMRAERAVDPPLFVLAGGPGRSSTRAFPRPELEQLLRGVSLRRDVVVADLRGTGDSGALRCAALQAAAGDVAVAECAAALGAQRAFYTSADSAADLEALRTALGYEDIAFLTSAYGSRVALQYAAAHPQHVERLVLQSPVGIGGADALDRPSFAATARVLRELCGRARCRSFTADPVRDLARLVRRLARATLEGAVTAPDGSRTQGSITRPELFALLTAGDAVPAIRRRFPAAVRAALAGDRAPLLWIEQLSLQEERTGARIASAAANAATLCAETALPWAPGAPAEERLEQAAAAAASEPPAAFAPFDAATAAAGDVIRRCAHWPAPGRSTGPAGPLPDVPVLVLTGTQTLGTPTEEARRIAAGFPQGSVLVAPGAGGDVLGSDAGNCASRSVRRFLRGKSVDDRCGGARLTPTPRDPLSPGALAPAARDRPQRTVAAVRRTYQTALRLLVELHEETVVDHVLGNTFEFTFFHFRMGGLRSGSVALTPFSVRFRDFSYVPGVRLNGTLSTASPGGRLSVRGPASARGTLRVRRNVMRGRLGGRQVRRALGPDMFDLALTAAFRDLGLAPLAPVSGSTTRARAGAP